LPDQTQKPDKDQGATKRGTESTVTTAKCKETEKKNVGEEFKKTNFAKAGKEEPIGQIFM
jgi:hypothetical protein